MARNSLSKALYFGSARGELLGEEGNRFPAITDVLLEDTADTNTGGVNGDGDTGIRRWERDVETLERAFLAEVKATLASGVQSRVRDWPL